MLRTCDLGFYQGPAATVCGKQAQQPRRSDFEPLYRGLQAIWDSLPSWTARQVDGRTSLQGCENPHSHGGTAISFIWLEELRAARLGTKCTRSCCIA